MPEPDIVPAAPPTNAGHCSAWRPPDEWCPSPIVMRALVGCEHGHTKDVAACAEHGLGLMTGETGCLDCLTGPQGHECLLLAMTDVVNLTGEDPR